MSFKKISPYLLLDYSFLQDYQILDDNDILTTNNANNNSFIAKIKNTTQKVKFTKVEYDEELFLRFQTLVKLFQDGVILADNIFMLEEAGRYYFYVIEAYVTGQIQDGVESGESQHQRFRNLQQYVLGGLNDAQKKDLLNKVKVLLQKVHQSGQYYGGLTSQKILIDDENNVYLSPFKLTHQLQNNMYEHAYRPPEILQKIINMDYIIQEKDLGKWDVWSFGCVCLEIFVFASPFYHSTSLRLQLEKVNKNELVSEFIQDLEEPVRNLIENCLAVNTEVRTICSQKIRNIKGSVGNCQSRKGVGVSSAFAKEKNKQTAISHSRPEMAVNHSQVKGDFDSELTLNLLSLENVSIQQELHITVYIGKAYHFYIDKPKKHQPRTILDKKITIKQNFTYFQSHINETILIELKQHDKIGKIRVNLQTLVIVYQGKRIWDKQLIGSYDVDKLSEEEEGFQNGKIKISCQLKSPEIIRKDEYQESRILLDAIASSAISKGGDVQFIEEEVGLKEQIDQKDQGKQMKMKDSLVIRKSLTSKGKQNKPEHLKKQVKKSQSRQRMSSIQEVKDSLSQLTNHWKKRNGLNNVCSEDIQQQKTREKIDNLLKIN